MDSEPFDRRRMILQSTCRFGAFVVTGFLSRAARAATIPAASGRSTGRAKAVINIFLAGGPSQMDTFDHKPALAKWDGQALPFKTPVMANAIANKIFRSPFQFSQHGNSGMWVSELLPNLAQCVDDLTVIRSMCHTQPDHMTATCYTHTGHERPGRPSLGAWLLHGLGSESQQLPGFVSLGTDLKDTSAAGFLPPACQATYFASADCPMADLKPREARAELQHRKRALLASLNGLDSQLHGSHPQMEAADSCYDLALRMQTAVPELYDFKHESAETLKRYGVSDPAMSAVATQCLVARRLIERGVRCVQINHSGWDHHGGLTSGIRQTTLQTDRPIAALLWDLKQRGMLDDTLVLWGGEFGRTPIGEDGREHNPYGYTVWLAGGGTRRGLVYGTTDEFGYYAEEKKVSVHDLHATVLHLLGLDHNTLTFRFSGRDFRLTDVDGEVVQGILDA